MLDAIVLLMVEPVVDVLRFFDVILIVAEQVIDVPKIIIEDIPSRISVGEPQLVEQLVEVPTILYFLKQTFEIPVPRGGGRRLQGFLPENCCTAFGGGLQGSRPGQGSTASSSSSVSRSTLRMRRSKVFFALFPGTQKVRGSQRSRVRECTRTRAHPS